MWTKKELPLWKVIIIRMCIILIMLSLSRWLLYIFNTNSFPGLSTKELFRLFLVGIRFDIYPLIVFNLPMLVFFGIPLPVKYNRRYAKTIDIVFIITNSLAIALNLVDVIYYRFLDKRMTSELFEFFKETDDNQGSMLWNFIRDYWFILAIFLVFLFFIILLTRKTTLKKYYIHSKPYWYVLHSVSFLMICGLSVIGMRGGLQLRPIELITAARYTATQNIPLVLNTPFTMCRGTDGEVLKKVEYFKDEEIDSLYSPIHTDLQSNRFIKVGTKNYNLVLIILESHGQEMISYYNKEREHSLTPFLDSLFSQSLTFDGLANGRRSIEALPSIFSGLPSLMAIDYPSSRYAMNHIDGFGTILKKYGYRTAFFHGGNNGTMSFNATAKGDGFDEYYGRDEYNNEADYDGTWGIFDGPYLQYVAKNLNDFEKPFAATIFTLSSHHPYALPKGYVEPDPTLSSPFEKTMRYDNDALQDFFETVSHYDWFDSTIFVITADHVNPEHEYETYRNGKGTYQVPIVFYAPQVFEPQRSNEIAQHSDLNVSILSALNINDTVFSFGRNVFDSLQKPVFISYLNHIFQFSDGRHFLKSDGKSINEVFDLESDPHLGNNIYKGDDEKWDYLYERFKLYWQQYNNRMINNKLYIDK